MKSPELQKWELEMSELDAEINARKIEDILDFLAKKFPGEVVSIQLADLIDRRKEHRANRPA